ncbi:MAG: LysR family transcriptional regulator [Myxococcales bacterium]|nr:LysR family transcriptional regulator [Myxococcales bacterium]
MNLNHLAVFRAVAEHKSFTAAAKALAADKAHVSRVLRGLEASFGVVLVNRTTRSVVLTPAGEGLFALVRGPLEALERAGATIADRARAPSGVVSLTTTPDLARVLVAPLLPGFRAQFPEVSVQLRVGAELESFTDPSLDVALRVGAQTSPDLRVRKVGELGAGFFASPRYLAARGTPREPRSLAAHETAWPHGAKKASFTDGGARPRPSVSCDDFAVILEFARAGGGVVVLPLHLAKAHVREGALVRLFPDIVLRGAPLYLVTRRERPLPARVEALKAHLIANVPSLMG